MFSAIGAFQASLEDISRHPVLLTISSCIEKTFHFLNFTSSTDSHSNSLATPLLFSYWLFSLCRWVKICCFSAPALFSVNTLFLGKPSSSHAFSNSQYVYDSLIHSCPSSQYQYLEVQAYSYFPLSSSSSRSSVDGCHLSLPSVMSSLQTFSSVFVGL